MNQQFVVLFCITTFLDIEINKKQNIKSNKNKKESKKKKKNDVLEKDKERINNTCLRDSSDSVCKFSRKELNMV